MKAEEWKQQFEFHTGNVLFYFILFILMNLNKVFSCISVYDIKYNFAVIGPTLDVDWRNNVSFATSSTDSMIYLCKIGETRPVRIFAGHQVLYLTFIFSFSQSFSHKLSHTNQTRG